MNYSWKERESEEDSSYVWFLYRLDKRVHVNGSHCMCDTCNIELKFKKKEKKKKVGPALSSIDCGCCGG